MDADEWRDEADGRAVALQKVLRASLIQQAAMTLDPLAYLAEVEGEFAELLAITLANVKDVDQRRARREVREALEAVLPGVVEHFRARRIP